MANACSYYMIFTKAILAGFSTKLVCWALNITGNHRFPHPPCYIGPDLCKLDFMHTFCNIYQGQKYCILLGALNSVTSVVLQKLKPTYTEKLHCNTVGSLP
jgi:hypothetical protein